MNLSELYECSEYTNEFGCIKLCDCLEGMRALDDNVVDVSFTSPPYNDKGSGLGDGHHKYIVDEEVQRNHVDWFEWQCNIIDEMLRVTKKYVLYNVQGISRNRTNVYKLIGKYSNRIHDIVIWNKSSSQPTSTKHKLSNRYEFLLILKCDGVKGVDVNSDFLWNVFDAEKKQKNPYASIHQAVMNKSFCDFVISEFTQENDCVLDVFNGMGTTSLCCMEQGRRFVGFEIFGTYLEESAKRLEEARMKINEEHQNE